MRYPLFAELYPSYQYVFMYAGICATPSTYEDFVWYVKSIYRFHKKKNDFNEPSLIRLLIKDVCKRVSQCDYAGTNKTKKIKNVALAEVSDLIFSN